MLLTSNKTKTLLGKYGIHAPITDARYRDHAELERGKPLRISCTEDPVRGKEIRLSCGGGEVSRLCPLSESDAATMVRDLREVHLFYAGTQERRTLEHLLERCSQLFVEQDLTNLTLSSVYLRSNDYTVLSAEIEAKASEEVELRLAPDAHDKGAVFPYRPTARLK